MTNNVFFLKMGRKILIGAIAAIVSNSMLSAEETAQKTFAYSCSNGQQITAQYFHNSVKLYLPDETVKLPLVRSASGVKFENDAITFWAKNNEALLLERGRHNISCEIDDNASIWEAARLEGADFRGIGSQRGWELLTYQQGKGIVLTVDYGFKSLVFRNGTTYPAFKQHPTVILAKNKKHEVHIELSETECRDGKKEQTYPVSVFIVVDNLYKLRGCGKPLE